jgi:hypothetical protein
METPEAIAKAAELHQRRVEEEKLKNPPVEGEDEEEEEEDDEEGEVDENEEFSSGEEEINVCCSHYSIFIVSFSFIHSHHLATFHSIQSGTSSRNLMMNYMIQLVLRKSLSIMIAIMRLENLTTMTKMVQMEAM